MNLLDYYYRGFKEYREETENNKGCQRDRKIYARNGLKFDYFKVTKYLCTIESDWIEALEKGLEFVEKAVAEERQFIRVNGEVVPIEKAKKVSKYSVEHLARHSNMITHVPDNPDDPIIPDSIYMVEKLSDYAVYENRFLYMLLCYIRDFIGLRLEKIQRLRMTYICDFKLKKDSDTKLRVLNYDTAFHEERYDNPYPIMDELSTSLLKRIEDCQQIVIMLLNTNLMNEVSKAPMIKPPIIKTNVLKMNNNFKNSLALYDYIVTYNSDGYKATEVVKDFTPFSSVLQDELAELGALTAFLTYKNGNEINDILQNNYIEEEQRRKDEEAAKLVDQIKRLKKRVAESGLSMEEYVLLVEKRNRMLEDDARELVIARNTIKELNEKIESLKQEIAELNRKIEALKLEIEEHLKEIARLNQKYIDDMAALKKQHAIEMAEQKKKYENQIAALIEIHHQEIEDLTNKYEAKINSLIEEYEGKLVKQSMDYEAKIETIKDDYESQIDEINDDHKQELVELEDRLTYEFQKEINANLQRISNLNGEVDNLNSEVSSLNGKIVNLNNDKDTCVRNYEDRLTGLISGYEQQIKEVRGTYESQMITDRDEFNNLKTELNENISNLKEANNLLHGELDTYRIEKGLLTPSIELTTKERFSELENEYLAFNEFFKNQWELTKKEIRKEIFWAKYERKRKKKLKKIKAPLNDEEAIDKLNKDEANDDINSDELNNINESIEDKPLENEAINDEAIEDEASKKKKKSKRK